MVDGRKNNGGKRAGAGRKSKAAEFGLASLVDSVWTIPNQKKVIKKLIQDSLSDDFRTRHESRKLLLAYKFGKPTEKRELFGSEGIPIEIIVTKPELPPAED